MMNNLNALKSTLCELATKQNRDFDSLLFSAQLQKALKRNGLDDSTRIPDWFVLFFDALLTGKIVPHSPYVYNQTSLEAISNFLMDIKDILHVQYEDEGEYMMITADKLQTFGVISLEGDTYRVGRLVA